MFDGGMWGWVVRGCGIIVMLCDMCYCIFVLVYDFVCVNVFGIVECDNC